MKPFELTKENLTPENITKAVQFQGTVKLEDIPEVREAVKSKIDELLTELHRKAKEQKTGFYSNN